jgi:hypothetical protein
VVAEVVAVLLLYMLAALHTMREVLAAEVLGFWVKDQAELLELEVSTPQLVAEVVRVAGLAGLDHITSLMMKATVVMGEVMEAAVDVWVADPVRLAAMVP